MQIYLNINTQILCLSIFRKQIFEYANVIELISY